MSGGAMLFAGFSAALTVMALVQVANFVARRRWPMARLTVQEVEIRRGMRGAFLHCRAVDADGYDWPVVHHHIKAPAQDLPRPGDTFNMHFDPECRDKVTTVDLGATVIIVALLLGGAALPWIASGWPAAAR